MLTMYQEDKGISRDLKPSQELLETIAEVRERYGRAKELVAQAYQLAIRDGFNPWQARDFLIAQLPFLGESTIRKALPPEAKEQSKVRLRSTVAQNTEPKEPNTVNITTKATIQDADLVKKDPPPQDDQEEPTELELARIEIQQLKDVIKKTEQFKPATAYDSHMELNPMNEKDVFGWLEKRDNGVSCYWYPNYGIELFKTRILTQLKGKGVTTFKRLYFEV